LFERLHIKNFQCHTDLVVDFAEGVTTIVGPSDRGKSAVMRALRWVCTNTPNGDNFITWGAELCTVTLYVDGHVVTRARGKGVNTYEVDGKVLKGFGTTVPKEVTDVLGLDAGGLNWQRQIDTHLWFHEKSSVVINEINRLVDMTVIDTATSRLSAQHRQAQTRCTIYTEDLRTAKATYEGLLGTPAKAAAWDAVLETFEAYTAAARKRETVAGLVATLRKHRERMHDLRTMGKDLAAVVQVGNKWQATANATKALQQLVEPCRAHCMALANGPPPAMPVGLVQARAAWQDAKAARDQLLPMVVAARAAAERCGIAKTQLKKAEATAASFKVCPTCKRPNRNP
jgi:hypothetical protein